MEYLVDQIQMCEQFKKMMVMRFSTEQGTVLSSINWIGKCFFVRKIYFYLYTADQNVTSICAASHYMGHFTVAFVGSPTKSSKLSPIQVLCLTL